MDKLITFETAQLAKQKDCDLIADFTFRGTTSVGESYQATTQTALQRWLREKHCIQAEVRTEPKYLEVPDYIPRIVTWTFNDIGSNCLSVSNLTDKTEKSYEAAFEIALQEALKLVVGQTKK